MIYKAFLLTFISFTIGAVAIILNGLKNKDLFKNRDRWIKFFIYLGIVHLIMLSICYHSLIRYVSLFIIGMGVFELYCVWEISGQRNNLLFLSLIFFSIVGFFFAKFSFEEDWTRQLLVYLFVFIFDGFSQITGQLIGKHKLSPKISPNKTVEGACGGFISVLLVSVFIHNDVPTHQLISIITTSFLIGLFALSGDLIASYFKRRCHVKDYSNLIPAHGGILDRFDSFIFSGALYWLFLI